MEQLITEYIPCSSSGMTTSINGNSFNVNMPQPSVNILKPLSYKFRVAEYEKDGEIVRVGLQVQVWEHSHFSGTIPYIKHDWTDVERVKIPI